MRAPWDHLAPRGYGDPATSAQLNQPTGVAVDPSGNIFIADRFNNHAIRKLDASWGNISTVAGTLGSSGSSKEGGPATSAKLNNPSGLAVDSSGNIFIADQINHAIRKVDGIDSATAMPRLSQWRFFSDGRPVRDRLRVVHTAGLGQPHPRFFVARLL